MTDLSKLSAEELKAELRRRTTQKEEDRKAYKELVNESIPSIVEGFKEISNSLSMSKLFAFRSLKNLLELKQKAYDVKDTQQSHTFSDDKGNTITYGFRVIDGWDDTVTAGVGKVRDFISSLAKDEDTGKLVHVVNQLLKKDAKGNLKASRVLELTKIAKEFNNEEFTDAVNIISQAYKPERSAFFIEVSVTDKQGRKISVPLSISSVGFPEGTNTEELFPVHEKYK